MRRDGTNGNSRRQSRPHVQSPLRVYGWNQYDDFTRRSGKISPGSSAAMRALAFVLQDEAENYFVPEPKELGLNGSFAVFKKIETDVVGFENFLQSNKDKKIG